MDINLIYKSRTGHTKQIAKAMSSVFNIEPIDISEPHVLGHTDLLIVGTGIYGGRPDESLLEYLNNLPANQIKGAAIFSSSISNKDQTELIVNILKSKNIEVLNKRFSCKGQFLLFGWGHPDLNDLKKAKEFAALILDSIA
ncbi:MAG: hypothetical protein GX675_07630 [Erysipelotrichaceae bacterium]|nr:hypothetical protein [Erysipelotrichaceae bacterium]